MWFFSGRIITKTLYAINVASLKYIYIRFAYVLIFAEKSQHSTLACMVTYMKLKTWIVQGSVRVLHLQNEWQYISIKYCLLQCKLQPIHIHVTSVLFLANSNILTCIAFYMYCESQSATYTNFKQITIHMNKTQNKMVSVRRSVPYSMTCTVIYNDQSSSAPDHVTSVLRNTIFFCCGRQKPEVVRGKLLDVNCSITVYLSFA